MAEKKAKKDAKSLIVEEGEEGYQRPALKSRQNKFGKYLAERKDQETFAPPVVLNARGKWLFDPMEGIEGF